MRRPISVALVIGSSVVLALLAAFVGAVQAETSDTSGLQTALLPSPHSTLVAEIAKANTTWNGPEPICAGGAGELVTSFVGNASGGTPPYDYEWNFGDGTPASFEQDPTHVYSWNVSEYLVTLTVKDATGITGEAGAIVLEPGFFCPPNPLPPALPSLFGIPALAIPTIVVAVGVAIVVLRMSFGGQTGPREPG